VTGEQELFDQDGRVLADAGMAVAENALDSRWRVAAQLEISRLAASGMPFSADDLRDRVGDPIGSPSGIGSLFRAASKAKEIVPCGWVESRRPAAHSRPLRLWRGVL
jgi:hypothetical protein